MLIYPAKSLSIPLVASVRSVFSTRSAPAKQQIAAKQHLPKPRMAAPLQTRSSGHHRHHRGNSIRPFSTKVGASTLTVKSGDIALENVSFAFCVL